VNQNTQATEKSESDEEFEKPMHFPIRTVYGEVPPEGLPFARDFILDARQALCKVKPAASGVWDKGA
jgi:hypothetical protein